MRFSATLFSPRKWQEAVRKLPNKDIICPPKTKNSRWEGRPRHRFQAWRGDKLLGAATAQAMADFTDVRDIGVATQIASKALSNRFMADHISTLLPPDTIPNMASDDNSSTLRKVFSDHKLGTMVEAAVAQVHDDVTDEKEKKAVLSDLARWLIATALDDKSTNHSHPATEKASSTFEFESDSSYDKMRMNPKGTLLELGGTVESYRVCGPDHAPIFTATATLHDTTITVSEGPWSKKQAEHIAARHVLDTLVGGADRFLLEKTSTREYSPPIVDHDDVGDWKNLNLSVDDTIVLKDGESVEEWWRRGAVKPLSALRRAMLAPQVFPQFIVCVHEWHQKMATSCTSFLAVTYRRPTMDHNSSDRSEPNENPDCIYDYDYYLTPVGRAPSFTKARVVAALDANEKISNIVASSTV